MPYVACCTVRRRGLQRVLSLQVVPMSIAPLMEEASSAAVVAAEVKPDKRVALSWPDRMRRVVAGAAFVPVIDAAAAAASIRDTTVVAVAEASFPFGAPFPS